MKCTYNISLSDMLTYQEQLFLSKKNPSLNNSIKRWEKVVFLSLGLFAPVILYLAFRSIPVTLVTALIGMACYGIFKRNSARYFWKNYKTKAKKDLLATYFDYDKTAKIPYTLNVLPDKLEIHSKFAKKEILNSDITFKKITDTYIFFYTNKHDASFIPLNEIASGKEEFLSWFS